MLQERCSARWLGAEEPRVTSCTARPGMYDMLWLVQRRTQHALVKCAMPVGAAGSLKY